MTLATSCRQAAAAGCAAAQSAADALPARTQRSSRRRRHSSRRRRRSRHSTHRTAPHPTSPLRLLGILASAPQTAPPRRLGRLSWRHRSQVPDASTGSHYCSHTRIYRDGGVLTTWCTGQLRMLSMVSRPSASLCSIPIDYPNTLLSERYPLHLQLLRLRRRRRLRTASPWRSGAPARALGPPCRSCASAQRPCSPGDAAVHDLLLRLQAPVSLLHSAMHSWQHTSMRSGSDTLCTIPSQTNGSGP